MNIEQAREILRQNGKPTCSCKYGNDINKMIEEAIKIQNTQKQI